LIDEDRKESIMIADMPQKQDYDNSLIEAFEQVKSIVTSIRNVRNDNGIARKEPLNLQYKGNHPEKLDAIISKLAFVEQIEPIETKPENAVSFLVSTNEYYVPLEGKLDTEEELKKLNEELEYTRGFLNSVMKKLNNERFVQNAPEKVIEKERTKKSDAESKIRTLEERIAQLKK